MGSQGRTCQDTKQSLPPWVPQPDPWVPSQAMCGSGMSVGTVFVLSFLPPAPARSSALCLFGPLQLSCFHPRFP